MLSMGSGQTRLRRHTGYDGLLSAASALLEKEDALARHQTGHNSGVVHAGP